MKYLTAVESSVEKNELEVIVLIHVTCKQNKYKTHAFPGFVLLLYFAFDTLLVFFTFPLGKLFF